MIWFKYLKSNQGTSSDQENTNYSYPQVKRKIERFKPSIDIAQGAWLSVDVTDLGIDSYLTDSLDEAVDATSYLVVYENTLRVDDFTPVVTKIYDNVVYFKAAENHESGVFIKKEYSLYYKTPGLQNINPVTNGQTTSYKISDSNNPYNPGSITDSVTSYTINVGDSGYYNFSFINSGIDWENGESNNLDSKVYINFLGPKITVNGSKGPSHGKLSYRIKPVNPKDSTYVVVDDYYVVDCYSTDQSSNTELFSVSNLEKEEYVLEIIVSGEKHPNASDSKVKLSNFVFDFDLGLEISKEYLSTNINFVTLNPSSSQGSVGGDPVYVSSGDSSSTTDTNVRDVRVRHIMEVM